MLASTRMEPLLRDIRLGMDGAGMYCEGVKGECNFGQQEIAFRYDHARVTCDNHTIYKNGAKEIADQHGKSLTFMAKFDEREGNSCHIHISLRGDDGSAVFADSDAPDGMSAMFRSFIAGQLATLRELTLFYAPNINSYKRFVEGSFAPTAIAWGMDNRTCSLRVVGHGHGMRMECRAPGGDVNQYLAVSALIAGGLHGIEQELELPEALEGNAYTSGAETSADHAGRGRRAVRQVAGGARGVRRRRRRALPQQRPRRVERRSTRRSPTGKGCVALSGSSFRPVLGLTTYLQQAQTGIWDVHASFLPAIYMDGVNLAGGTAVLLPPQPIDAAERVLDGLDGLIITGGRDIDPDSYGQPRHPSTDEPMPANRDRDAWEVALVRGRDPAGHAGARHLPRCAGRQRGAGWHAAPASARCHRAHPPSTGQRGVLHVGGPHRARHPAGRADR